MYPPDFFVYPDIFMYPPPPEIKYFVTFYSTSFVMNTLIYYTFDQKVYYLYHPITY